MTLSERIEKLDGPCREIDQLIAKARGWEPSVLTKIHQRPIETSQWFYGNKFMGGLPCFTASVDAAMGLVPEGMAWTLDGGDTSCLCSAEIGKVPARGRLLNPEWVGEGTTPALAICAAAVRAMENGDAP